MQNSNVIIALENLRSLLNIGAIIRTSEFHGIKKVILIGYSGVEHRYRNNLKEEIIIHSKLQKTSLGTIEKIEVEHFNDVKSMMQKYSDFDLIGIEQTENSIDLYDWDLTTQKEKMILLLGNEVEGIEKTSLKLCTRVIEIARIGTHQSLNVEAAAAIVISYITSQSPNQKNAKMPL